jgi:hypothetical protein
LKVDQLEFEDEEEGVVEASRGETLLVGVEGDLELEAIGGGIV